VPVADEVHRLDLDVRGGVERIGDWLVDGPLGLSERQVDRSIERGFDQLRANGGVFASGLLSGTVLLVELVAGVLLTLFLLFFFLKDGDRIWDWVVRLFPRRARGDVEAIGAQSWQMLGGYLRGVALVALVDAVLIGSGLAIVGVALVLPLAVLTFLAGFFPIVGANVAGFAAAMVALVSNGLTAALVVVGIVVLVQQLEGHLLQPLIVGRSVRLHPVAILLAIAGGAVLWGIAGAFLAVPLTAVCATAASHLRRGSRSPAPGGH
jgi:predicted PurR-regulated permease PerM